MPLAMYLVNSRINNCYLVDKVQNRHHLKKAKENVKSTFIFGLDVSYPFQMKIFCSNLHCILLNTYEMALSEFAWYRAILL